MMKWTQYVVSWKDVDNVLHTRIERSQFDALTVRREAKLKGYDPETTMRVIYWAKPYEEKFIIR